MLWPGNRLQTPASNLLRETPCSPTSLLTDPDQSCVLGELPLKDLFQAVFPWDGQLQQHYLLAGLRHKDNVWSQGGVCNVAGELQLMLKNRVIFSLQDRFPSNLNFNGRSTLVQLRPREATVILNYR